MGPVAKEIKQTLDEWHERYGYCFDENICDIDPFSIDPFSGDHYWYHIFLFPELLQKWDESEYYKIYPCNVCSEGQVMRIMNEVIGNFPSNFKKETLNA